VKTARVVVAHTAVAPGADRSTSDVLDQAHLVERALASLEWPFTTIAVREGRVWEHAETIAGAVVFNLLEAPPGKPQLNAAATAALELLAVRFTGSPAAAVWLTTDKLGTRAVLADAGLPVAAGGRLDPDEPTGLARIPPPWILKPAWEDASVGLDGSPVATELEPAMARARLLEDRFPGQPLLVEHFLPGREFNVSLLEGPGGVEALPVAEIAFVDFPPDVPALVGYEAKWATGSFEETHTVRRFPGREDARLLARVRELATAAWRACGLAGYGRVDMRLDEGGLPVILEVNANPCLSPDAGFMAAAGEAGLWEAAVVGRIIEAALRRG
jgi:D-alanine-D-alanine ligase